MPKRRPPTLATVSDTYETPRSPRDEIEGIPYFPRLCHKIRLHAEGKLHPQYQGNLGAASDLWTCQFLGVDYADLAEQVRAGMSDAEALAWTREKGIARPDCEIAWWHSFIRTRGFRDDLAERLVQRKAESGFADRGDIQTFFDYIDADEGRM